MLIAPGASSLTKDRPEVGSLGSLIPRAWRRLPVVVRAVLAGALVMFFGSAMSGPLLFANLKLWPAVPWSVPLLAIYIWIFWQYIGGRWWPRSTAEARRQGLRARRLTRPVWFWSLLAGYLGMVCSYALHYVVGRLAPLRFALPDLLDPFPPLTLFTIILALSAVAGIVEEAAFRGYMQGPIEKRHGIVIAILVVSAVFGAAHLTDAQPTMTIARMFFIVAASVVYGILVHMVDSILPGLVLHATGDAIGIALIIWLSRRPAAGPRAPGLAAALAEPWFLANLAVVLVFGSASVWAFRKLASVVREEHR